MPNIQQYFSAISLSHIRSYLLGQGWEISPQSGASQILFLGPMHDQGARYELYFPTDEKHAKFRDRVQRSIFNLSCIEDREPIEVAEDIAASRTDTPQPAVAPEPIESGPERLTFENQSRELLTIRVTQTEAQVQLSTGDAVQLRIDRDRSSHTQVTYEHQQITVSAVAANELKVFQLGLGGLNMAPTVAAIVQHELRSDKIEIEALDNMLTEMKSTFSRADFALSASQSAGVPPQTTRQQTALIVAVLASRLHKANVTQLAGPLWRIACRLLNRGEIALRIVAGDEQDLLAVAMTDEELAPHRIMGWLESHSQHADVE